MDIPETMGPRGQAKRLAASAPQRIMPQRKKSRPLAPLPLANVTLCPAEQGRATLVAASHYSTLTPPPPEQAQPKLAKPVRRADGHPTAAASRAPAPVPPEPPGAAVAFSPRGDDRILDNTFPQLSDALVADAAAQGWFGDAPEAPLDAQNTFLTPFPSVLRPAPGTNGATSQIGWGHGPPDYASYTQLLGPVATASGGPMPPLARNMLLAMGFGEEAIQSAESQGIAREVCEHVLLWIGKASERGLEPCWVHNEINSSIMRKDFFGLVDQLRVLERLPLTKVDGRCTAIKSAEMFLLSSLRTTRDALQGLYLSGFQLAEMLALPSGLPVLWFAMNHWSDLVPLKLTLRQLKQIAGQPDGEEALRAVHDLWAPLVRVGFGRNQINRLVISPLGARKLQLARAMQSIFEQGQMAPEKFVEWGTNPSIGISQLEHMIFSCRRAKAFVTYGTHLRQ